MVYVIIYVPGSPWSWKFPHQSQNRSILPNSREKELLNGYFHSRTLFLTPERFRTVLNAFWTLFSTLFERFLNAFLHSRTSEVSGTAKTTLVFFFPHQPPKSIFFGFGVKKSSIWELQVYIYICIYICIYIYIIIYIYTHVFFNMEKRKHRGLAKYDNPRLLRVRTGDAYDTLLRFSVTRSLEIQHPSGDESGATQPGYDIHSLPWKMVHL